LSWCRVDTEQARKKLIRTVARVDKRLLLLKQPVELRLRYARGTVRRTALRARSVT
jgi:hypothetical protein